jgi:uncharacterized membrane protein
MMVVTAAVALPEVCHLLGRALGVQTALGEWLLPMHLPVMLAGMLWGPWVGVSCGLISPVVSFALTGMPGAALLPFMTVELAVYGLSAGLLSKTNLPTLLQVVLTQVAGRVARAAVLAAAIYGFGFDRLPISIVWTSITAGVAGIVIQWAVLPLAAREGKR